jgi:D-glycero-D-manno-heptose 1,7-bisphosphate phosphatase
MASKRPALFLDRDGVVNIDHGYVCKPENFDFVTGIFDLVATANSFGYLVVIVTNQAGIGRGYYTEDDFHALTKWMRAQFISRGARVDAVYFCPDHPEHGLGAYKRESIFRKPGPGMLLQAAKELGVDLSISLLVGDKDSDIQAGVTAGVGSLVYFHPEIKHARAQNVTNLKDVIELITSASKHVF